MRPLVHLGLFALGLVATACSADAARDATAEDGASGSDAITSTDGQPLELEFATEVVASRDTPVKNAVIAQLEYLQGHLTTGPGGNAQFRFVDVRDATESPEGAAKKRIAYRGSVAVILPAGTSVPRSYELALPRDVTELRAFNEKYDGTCGRNEYGRETFWHDWNPRMAGCTLGADVVRTSATVRPHPLGTTDKYPEYDAIWDDGRLDVVVVYGAVANTSTTDTGARGREAFLSKVTRALDGPAREDLSARGGVIAQSIVTGKKTVGGAPRDVRVVAYFVSEPQSAGAEFERSYGEETAKADFIHYSGHSGLGKNIAALAKASRATAGKYQVAFFNGCQTFGYLGPWMHEARRELNGAAVDPHGTKFLDVVVTTLPAYSEQTPTEQLFFDALLERKKGWQQLLRIFSGEQWSKHLTAVFGEDDNAFRP